MKLNRLLIGMNVGAGLLGAVAAWACNASATLLLPGVGLVLVLCGGAGWAANQMMQRGLKDIEKVAEGKGKSTSSGLVELDQLAERVRDVVTRWTDSSHAARQGIRDVELIVTELTQSDSSTSTSTQALASRLRQLFRRLDEQLRPSLTHLSEEATSLQQTLSALKSGTSDQTESVSRATTYVEQLCVHFDSVAESANSAQQASASAQEVSQDAQLLVNQHRERAEHLHQLMEVSERKVRMLKERAQEIRSIIETIGAISSRTDLLALNASIESIRAGEQGRGFSIVADEVRKLAEQAAHASRDVSTLIDAIRADADDSAASIGDQREKLSEEIEAIRTTTTRLTQIGQTCEQSRERIQHIAQLAGQQLHLTQSLVTTVEQISQTNRQNRTSADNAVWASSVIAKAVDQIEDTLTPLHLSSAAAQDKRKQRRSRSTSEVGSAMTDAGRRDDGDMPAQQEALAEIHG